MGPDTDDNVWQEEPVEKTAAELPCFNCGKLVTVMIPFFGCIYCEACSSADNSTNDYYGVEIN